MEPTAIALSHTTQEALENIAKAQNKTVDQIVHEAIDLYIFALKIVQPQGSNTPQIHPLDLENEPFVEMWRDRPEMQDSTAWVKQLRQTGIDSQTEA